MGKASRAKRKRAAVRSAKRSRGNNWWYGLIALIVIAGVGLLVYSRASQPAEVGPYVANQANAEDPHNKDSHWHAALGVYDCDHWLGDQSGEGLWVWPIATPGGSPGRADNTSAYAGMHSHADGIIHMEPLTSEDAGHHATIGKYFEYGGWKVNATGYDFLGVKRANGDKCGDQAGTMQWAVAKWDGTEPPGPQKFVVKTGNPADYKLNNDDVVIVAFLPPGKTIESLGNPPSIKNLPNATGTETPPGQMPPLTPTTPPGPVVTTPTTPAGTTPTSAAPSAPTSQP